MQLVQEMQSVCDWSRIEELTRQLVEVVESQSASVNPFVFLGRSKLTAKTTGCWRGGGPRSTWGAGGETADGAGGHATRKITLGYLSADFQEHATAHLIAELFTLHDRDRFRVILSIRMASMTGARCGGG